MKSRILALALVLTVAATNVFANNEIDVNKKVIEAFKTEFAQAVEVKWESAKEFVKATFRMNEQEMVAYYSEDGKLIAVTRQLVMGQLPINLQSTVKSNYKESRIADLFEVSSGDETAYYVSLETAKLKVVLKSVGAQGWTIYKKEKKNFSN
jgi:hypothetical protein